MTTHEMTDSEFRHAMRSCGPFTSLPRWTLAPVPGTAERTAEIPRRLTRELRRLAADTGIPFSAVLLTAHIKVLSTLSGEPDVGFGCVAEPGTVPVPFRIRADAVSWRELLREVSRVETDVALHRTSPAQCSRSPQAQAPVAPPCVFDPYGGTDPPDATTVLHVTVAGQGEQLFLPLRYRTDALDEDFATRAAGYHLRALESMAADPDAAPGPQSLVGAAELQRQLTVFTGDRRDLPDLRAHELLEQRARSRPEAVAVVHGASRWTYAELNARANLLARALLARGLRPEDPVAVVCERNLHWAAAVLAVLKSGGAYLPVEPRFPADRVAAMITRASCRFALTGPGVTTSLRRTLQLHRDMQAVDIGTAYTEGHAAGDPGLSVPADSLAYIYFTSGSTGEPKGVMCEHAGMLNHLYAKISDLGIGPGQTVAQTAPQCFDISLWQLLAGPLAGGRTLIVEQDAIMDIERFLDTVVAGRVNVLQLVPSYLDAVLASLELSPCDMPDLRCVSVTGEAVKKHLVERWFANRPGIRLVNAYGLTETCDDTNHEVMDQVPGGDRIALGRPVANVGVRVLGPDLEPLPLGAPGEIVFSGVCVGRGYVNDPERTRLAFPPDPHDLSGRIYRSGDRGRWLADGRLEFLGRRDGQVKIRGFRIELAEVENALARTKGIRDVAVVVVPENRGGPYLAAFYTTSAARRADALREQLSRRLPAYMVPSAFHRLDELPVTANGKTDTKALLDMASAHGGTSDSLQVPTGPTERRLAAAWSHALGVPVERIGRQDRFFDLGGTSLSALRVVIALDKEITLTDLTRHSRLADLARLIERKDDVQVPGPVRHPPSA
ncbi:amino acid adenylation domain-containing protein [Streptomyces erythrochromogenes]|uniref:amino acid adenylation domain-containing protein n=1 Tax=Streptomyces erythrochromogenes TaxID=285574 RepID=UPI00341557E5